MISKYSLKFRWEVLVEAKSKKDAEKWIEFLLNFHYFDREMVKVVIEDADNTRTIVEGMYGMSSIREDRRELIPMQQKTGGVQMDSCEEDDGGSKMNMKYCCNCDKWFHEKDVRIEERKLYNDLIRVKFCPNCARIWGHPENLTYGKKPPREIICEDFGIAYDPEDQSCKSCSCSSDCAELTKRVKAAREIVHSAFTDDGRTAEMAEIEISKIMKEIEERRWRK